MENFGGYFGKDNILLAWTRVTRRDKFVIINQIGIIYYILFAYRMHVFALSVLTVHLSSPSFQIKFKNTKKKKKILELNTSANL